MANFTEEGILYKEEQRYTQWWIWLIILAVNAIIVYGCIMQVLGGKQFGDNPMSNVGLIMFMLLFLAFSFFISRFRLQTNVKSDGVYVRFFPFQYKYKFYAWETITKSHVRSYSAFREFGGWGVRYGFFGKGRAFTLKGNKGWQLEFADKGKLLIGTQRPEDLTSFLVETKHWVE
ncbi:MAG: hypothetical protein IPP51_17980 [Bacteroidetes bacterium]|nr:hypothetical protein [Bacteroidota bacterium]